MDSSSPTGAIFAMLEAHARSLSQRSKAAIVATIASLSIFVIGAGYAIARVKGYLSTDTPNIENIAGITVSLALIPILVNGVAQVAREDRAKEQRKENKIQAIEAEVRENPDKPQLAWDLARTKLESYLEGNLRQVKSIYWLTTVVMLVGFGIISYALVKAFSNPSTLPVAIVASASGVLISFIGGSFLVIYKSVLAQSASYVSVLERINAVGMAVQVIATIPDTDGELKHSSTAELSRQLLGMYSGSAPSRISHPIARPSTRGRTPK